jgi:putative alpha-1,2-mannosidase
MARQAWARQLGTIVADSADHERPRAFYTCLWRALLYPAFAGQLMAGVVNACRGLLRHATEASPDPHHGRPCLAEFLRHGYIPADVKDHKKVSNSLDFVDGDFCIGRIAELMGETDLAREFERRAGGYRHLFDAATALQFRSLKVAPATGDLLERAGEPCRLVPRWSAQRRSPRWASDCTPRTRSEVN